MKKRYIVVPAAMALLLGICASCASNELPSGFDRDQVIKTSEGFIDQLNAKDYARCYDQFSERDEGIHEPKEAREYVYVHLRRTGRVCPI